MSGCYAVFHKQLGDLVLLEPALARLRGHHGSPVAVMTRTGHAPLLALTEGLRFQRGLPLLPRRGLYCFDPLNKSALRSALTPAFPRHCILPDREESSWFHSPIFGDLIVPGLGDRYVAEYFWTNTPVPSASAFRPPRLAPPPADWKPPGKGKEPFVLLNPTSGWRQKNWLPERWVQVLRSLEDAGAPRVLMTSAATDWQIQHCREIADRGGPLVQSLSNHTSLKNFLWLCANARMVLTVDGAAAHLAAAFSVPSLTLFGPTKLSNWHFPTPANRALAAPPSRDGKARLKNLPAEEVGAAAEKLWTQVSGQK